MNLRTARVEESDALTALCLRSKAHWGYDAAFMRMSEASLTISPALIETGRVLVVEDGKLLGMASLDPLEDGVYDLLHMFVDPAAIGRGVGAALFGAISAKACEEGASALTILADPNAVPFYLKMGAVLTGDAPSDAIPGRRLPTLRYAIPAPATPR
jgi:GNAT superfamily N-acetyltransferase